MAKKDETPAAVEAMRDLSKGEMLSLLDEVLDDLDMPVAERQAVMRRLGKRSHASKIPAVIDNRWILDTLEEKIALALSYLDEFTLARANARDIASVVNVLMEKRQLIRGEPTQIVSNEERKALDELVPELLKECARRGMTVDLGPEHYQVQEQARITGLSKTAEPQFVHEGGHAPLMRKKT